MTLLNPFSTLKGRQHALLKLWFPCTYLHALTEQKRAIFIVIVVETSNLMLFQLITFLCILLSTGGSDDWARGVARIKYTYTIELRDRGSFGFILPVQYILPTAREALAAVMTLAGEIASVR
jgi:hypothetical protein